jgi:glutaminyl-peptide cyclotransferase
VSKQVKRAADGLNMHKIEATRAIKAMDNSGRVQVTAGRVLEQSAIPVYAYKIAHTHPHDRASYTEGLVAENGLVYEGTGLYGQSKLRKWELRTGRILREIDLDPHYFGEGIAIFNGAIYQLTYLSNTGFIYDQVTLQRIATFRYISQGWGLTSDGEQLLMSDGSSAVIYVRPPSFKVEKCIFATDNVGPVGFLNALEYADGKLYANIWQTNFIAVIDPLTGSVIGWIDLTGINPEPDVLVQPYVLNGIAFNKDTSRLLVTGKCWPNIYEIELVKRTEQSGAKRLKGNISKRSLGV